MAKKAGKRRAGISLGVWIFLITAVLIVLTAGSALVATWTLGDADARRDVDEALRGSHSVYTALQQQRIRQLELISRIFATDQILTSYLADATRAGDPTAVIDAMEAYQNLLRFDLALVLDNTGRVLTRTDNPGGGGQELGDDPLIEGALKDQKAFGVWSEGKNLYHAVAVPLVRQYDLVGYVVVALAVNDALALQVQRTSGADALFLANSSEGPVIAAAPSTLDPQLRDELIPELRLQGDVLASVTQRGETVDRVELPLQGGEWIAFLAPLRDAANTPVGAVVSLASLEAELAGYRRILMVVTGAGVLALVLAFLLAFAVARRSQGPVKALAAATEEAANGNLEVALPPGGGGDVGRMRDALGQLLRLLREKLALEYYYGRVARFLPEPAKSAGQVRPQAHELALVSVEMRRFANPKIGYDPEENLGRFNRDLKRIAVAAESQKGRVEAVYGHRVLATFEGDNRAFRALTAATEILHVLSERENVFDEPEPPVVALSAGNAVTGSVSWGEQPVHGVAGVAVQQLESLAREATPGELYLTKPICVELLPRLQRASVQPRAQRGIVSPMPVYALSTDQAAAITGYQPAALTTTGFAEEQRGIADLKPGMVLGSRFDILAELGVGRMGPVLKAQDRELGDLVTLKMLKPEIVADAAQFDRLRSVIRRACAIRHPNVLTVLDFGEADGIPYISAEFERGMTLRHALQQTRQLPLVAGLRLARQLCFGVLAGHNEKLLHRGIKPENILLTASGTAKLMDFGMTQPGTVVTGAEYLAPEQILGREPDSRVDIYSAGAVLYETFTGQPPYPGSTLEELRQQHAAGDPAAPSTLCEMPPKLEQILMRCLARSPEQRYSTVGELLKELEGVEV